MYRLICSFAVFVLFPCALYAQSGTGNITFDVKNAGSVQFSHDYHTKTRGIKCSACHFQTFAAGNGGFQMKKEKITKRDFCQHCHNGLKGFDAQSEKNCARCHK